MFFGLPVLCGDSAARIDQCGYGQISVFPTVRVVDHSSALINTNRMTGDTFAIHPFQASDRQAAPTKAGWTGAVDR